MIHIPVLRWGEPYKSMEVDKVVHFATGEVLAEVSRGGIGVVVMVALSGHPGGVE